MKLGRHGNHWKEEEEEDNWKSASLVPRKEEEDKLSIGHITNTKHIGRNTKQDPRTIPLPIATPNALPTTHTSLPV